MKIKSLHPSAGSGQVIFISAPLGKLGASYFQINLIACLAVVEPVPFHDVLFEVQRTETFIEKKINEFFFKVQRTETKDMEMWRCEDASPAVAEPVEAPKVEDQEFAPFGRLRASYFQICTSRQARGKLFPN